MQHELQSRTETTRLAHAAVRLSSQIAFYAITVAGAYLALNLLLLMAAPFLLGWSIAEKTAVTVPPMVVIMIHVVVPIAVRTRARILAHC